MTQVDQADQDGAARSRRPGPSVRTRVVEVLDGTAREREDRLATEEPLEIRLGWPGAAARRLAVTMRTPGHDFELAAGWLVGERILGSDQVAAVAYCTDADLSPTEEFNVVTVTATGPPGRLPAARAVTSACGVCGSDSISDLLADLPARTGSARLPAAVVGRLPETLREQQPGFDRTGGLHAAGLFGLDGTPVVVREDVGRHNAVDKVLGARVLAALPVPPVLVLSGRVGFELVQKAAVSGVEVIVAVGAPTSLAVSLAQQVGIGLAGFTRSERCVLYAGQDRFEV